MVTTLQSKINSKGYRIYYEIIDIIVSIPSIVLVLLALNVHMTIYYLVIIIYRWKFLVF